ALLYRGAFAEAAALLRLARRQSPTDFWVHFQLGQSLRRERGEGPGKRGGELDEEIGSYRAALALRPDNFAVNSNLGISLAAKGQLDEAVAAFRQAITLGPQMAVAHFNLGLALRDKGQLDEAIAAYRQAIRLGPK